ncbi:hypothetical protein ANO11243_031180 [Dothideomycetidae sp. 11243]|nr:hypothetical protein ANO11243_031180 [fungal sp. No.11243]
MDIGDISVLEYARAHGLSRDYQSDSVFESLSFRETAWELRTDGIDKDMILPTLSIDTLHITAEAWSIDRITADLLKSILKPSLDPYDDLTHRPRGIELIRMQMPLLQTDDELEFNVLASRHELTRSAELKAITRSLRNQSDPSTEDLEWPLMDLGLSNRVNADLSSEKMQITRDALLLIKDIVNPPRIETLDDWKIHAGSGFRFSSPALPLSPAGSKVAQAHHGRETDALLTSSPIDPTTSQLQAVHDGILFEPLEELPTQVRGSSPMALSDVIFGDLMGYAPITSSSPIKRIMPEDFKMDAPLTPHTTCSSPFKKTKLDDLVAKEMKELEIERPSTSLSDERTYNEFFDHVFDLSRPALLAIEDEQLQEADNTLRMPVPLLREETMHSSRTPFPGLSREVDGQHFLPSNVRDQLLISHKKSLIDDELVWPLSGLHLMSWNPLPMLTCRNVINETWEETVPDYFRQTLLGEVDMDSYSSKQSGLRLMDDDSGDEADLGVLHSDDRREYDLAHLARGRGLEIQDAGLSPARPCKARPTGGYLNTCSTLDALNHFFDLSKGVGVSEDSRTRQLAAESLQERSKISPLLESNEKAEEISFDAPHPNIDLSLAPRHIIISSTILSDRPLVSSLRQLLRGTTFIERSLSSDTDADILVTPTTGLILTTLQKLKQRSLPGTNVYKPNLVHARITSLAERYENLLVLVSTPCQLDASDTAAVNEVTNLATRLRCCVRTTLLPFAGNRIDSVSISRWAAALICAAQVGSKAMEFHEGLGDDIQTDTTQERFLRAIGLDALAALTVTRSIQSISADGSGVMAHLALLSPSERAHLLFPSIGAEAVQKLNHVLDAHWAAA